MVNVKVNIPVPWILWVMGQSWEKILPPVWQFGAFILFLSFASSVVGKKTSSPKWWWKMAMNPMGSNPPKNHQLNKSKMFIVPRHPVIPPEVWCFRYVFFGSKYRTSGGGPGCLGCTALYLCRRCWTGFTPSKSRPEFFTSQLKNPFEAQRPKKTDLWWKPSSGEARQEFLDFKIMHTKIDKMGPKTSYK